VCDCKLLNSVSGIHVSSEEVLRLRSVAQEAAKKKQSIVFLPCHKSHVDYVSLQIICYRLGIGLPIVVAGDNLNIPLLGPFLQHAGTVHHQALSTIAANFFRRYVD
jgi:glycerol-3-phosphate O-acyltransferase